MIYGLIPARKGSIRIKNKNMKLLNLKPLIYYTIKNACRSKLRKIIISTDYSQDEIENVFPSYCGKRYEYVKRPDYLCTNDALADGYIYHMIKHMDLKNSDSICLLQPTCPLRDFMDINQAISIYNKYDRDSLVSVYRLENANRIYDYNCQHMQLPKNRYVYVRNSAIYIFRVGMFKYNTDGIFEKSPLLFVMPVQKSIDINEQYDFDYASVIMEEGD